MINILLAELVNPIAPNLSPKTGAQGVQFFASLLQSLIAVFLAFGFIAFFFYFILGAIKWVLSGGDKGAVEAARNQITHAIIGLVILVALFAIIRLIETVLNVCILFVDVGSLQVGSQSGLNPSCGIRGDTPIPGGLSPGLAPEEGGLRP